LIRAGTNALAGGHFSFSSHAIFSALFSWKVRWRVYRESSAKTIARFAKQLTGAPCITNLLLGRECARMASTESPQLRIYNSLTRSKDVFRPLQGNQVGLVLRFSLIFI
jgi:hypothetical protein